MKLETDLGFTMAYYILIGICINLDCFILSCYVFLVGADYLESLSIHILSVMIDHPGHSTYFAFQVTVSCFCVNQTSR